MERLMSRRAARTALSLLALTAAWGAATDGTLSAFNATSTTASNTFTAAPDWTAPTISVAGIGRTGAYEVGFIMKGASYYIFSNASDSGNPASGITSITANVSSITSGATAAALTSGSYNAGGITYKYRSALLTAGASLTAGTYNYTTTSTDAAGNTATQSFTTTVDNTPPTALDVQSTNVSGGTVGHLDQGDTLTLTYSAVIDPYSVLSGWTGTATNVQIALTSGGGTTTDSIYVYSTAATPVQIPVGTIELGASNYLNGNAGSYIVYGATGSTTPSTMTRIGSTIVLTLGVTHEASLTSTTRANMSWNPSTSATDIAGNPVSSTTTKQSGTARINF
jgi:chitinase